MQTTFNNPQYSVLKPQKEDVFDDKKDAEFLGTQYSMAAGELTPDSVDYSTNMLQQGESSLLREAIAAKRNAETPQIKSEILQNALSEGNVDTAYQAATTQIEPVSPNLIVEQAVAEEGSTHKLLTEDIKSKEDFSPKDLEDSERLLTIGNFFLEMQKGLASYQSPEYVGDPKEAMKKAGVAFDAFFKGEEGVSLPSVWLLKKGVALDQFQEAAGEVASVFTKDFYIDLLSSFINTPTALTKSQGEASKLIFPGDAGREFQNNLVTLPPKELASYLSEKTAYIQEAIGNNPLRAFSVAWDMVYASSIFNPTESEQQFNLLRKREKIPVLVTDKKGNQVLDADGQPQYTMQPNPLYENFHQSDEGATNKFLSAMDATVSKASIQSVVDNPALDILGVVGLTRGTLKGLGRLKTIINVMGRGAAAQYVYSQAVRGTNTTAEVLHHVSTMVSPTSYVDPELAAIMGHIDAKTVDMLSNVSVAPRVNLTTQEVAQSTLNLQNTETVFQREFMYSFHETSEGNNFITSAYGTGKGGGFITEASAKQWASTKGLLNYKVLEPTPGNFYVAVRTALDESGFYQGSTHIPNGIDYIRSFLGLGKYVFTPTVTSGRELGAAASSAPLVTGAFAEISRYLASNMKGLSSKQITRLSEILDAGKNAPDPSNPGLQGKWFDEAEFNQLYYSKFGEMPTLKDRTAYYVTKKVSDLSYSYMSKGEYDKAVALGISAFKSANAQSEFFGKVVANDSIKGTFLVKLQNGGFTSDPRVLAQALSQPDAIAFRVYGDMDINGKTVTHILGTRGEFKDLGLPQNILSYTPGGTRAYYEKFFLKGRNSDRVFTLGVFSSKKAGLAHKAKIDQALGIYRQFQNDMAAANRGGSLTAAIERRIRAQYDPALQLIDRSFNTASFDSHVRSGMLDPKAEYHVLYDRQSFPGQAGADDFKAIETSLKQENGRMYYSKRGAMLFEDGGNTPATLVNPFEALTQQLTHSVRMAGFSDFSIQQMQTWAIKYQPFMTEPSQGLKILDQIFSEGKFPTNPMPGITHRQMDLAEAERMHIKRLLGHPDSVSAAIQTTRNLLAEKMATALGDSDTNLLRHLESFRRGTIADGDVLGGLRSIAYDLHMGFFNTSQLFVQGLGALSAISMHPLYGTVALAEGMLMWPLMMFSHNQKAIDLIDKSAAALKYLPAGEFKKIMKDYRATGLHNVRHSDTQLDVLANIDGLGKGGIYNNLKTVGRTFVYEGERFARVVTFNIARRIADEEVLAGRLVRNSAEYIQFIRGKTGALTLNMLSGMEAAWSKNPVTSLGFQMLQYPIKATEVFLGLNKQLTSEEKLMFFVTHPLLVGAYGVPFGPQLLDMYVEKFNPGYTKEEYLTRLQGGIDKFVRNTFEIDSAFSQKIGYGDFWAGFTTELMDKSIFHFLGGIVLDDVLKIYSKLPVIGNIMLSAFSAGQINTVDLRNESEDVLISFGKMASGFSSWRKAYILDQYGQLLNSAGTSVIDYNSKYSVLLTALGFQSSKEILDYRGVPSEIQKQKDITAASKQIAEQLIITIQAQQDLLNNPKDQEAKSRLKLANKSIGATLNSFDPEDRLEINSKAKFRVQSDKDYQTRARMIKMNINMQGEE